MRARATCHVFCRPSPGAIAGWIAALGLACGGPNAPVRDDARQPTRVIVPPAPSQATLDAVAGVRCETIRTETLPEVLPPSLGHAYQKRLAVCFAPIEDKQKEDGLDKIGEAALRYFVEIPSALDAAARRMYPPPTYDFLLDANERNRAKALLSAWMRWEGWDDPLSEEERARAYPPSLVRTSDRIMPFAFLHLSCDELGSLRPATRNAWLLQEHLRSDSGCPGPVPISVVQSALAGTTEARATACDLLSRAPTPPLLRNAVFHAELSDRGRSKCVGYGWGRQAGPIYIPGDCAKTETHWPGRDACRRVAIRDHAIVVEQVTVDRGLTIRFTYRGHPRLVVAVGQDREGRAVGPIFSSAPSRPPPESLSLPAAPPSSVRVRKVAPLFLERGAEREGGVATYVAKVQSSPPVLVLVIVDEDGAETRAEPR